MSMFEAETSPTRAARVPIPMSEIDRALTAQFVVAWAGESGEEKRLGWWRSDLVSEFGGKDLFRRLLPSTWAWAVLQGAREAARRKDAELRRQDHDPDRILSLFSLGFELDERARRAAPGSQAFRTSAGRGVARTGGRHRDNVEPGSVPRLGSRPSRRGNHADADRPSHQRGSASESRAAGASFGRRVRATR